MHNLFISLVDREFFFISWFLHLMFDFIFYYSKTIFSYSLISFTNQLHFNFEHFHLFAENFWYLCFINHNLSILIRKFFAFEFIFQVYPTKIFYSIYINQFCFDIDFQVISILLFIMRNYGLFIGISATHLKPRLYAFKYYLCLLR